MVPRRPCLTPAQLQLITERCAQGLTRPHIAQQLSVTYLQVRGAVRRQGLQPTSAKLGRGPGPLPGLPAGRRPRPRPVSLESGSLTPQQLVAHWQQSGLSIRLLAQHLGVDWRRLRHELRGLRQMGAVRLVRLPKLLPRLGSYACQRLSPVRQLYWVLRHGTCLAQRWEADDEGVNLSHCADEGRGFFVEVGVAQGPDQPIGLRSFVSSVPLEDYSHYVQLPEGWA